MKVKYPPWKLGDFYRICDRTGFKMKYNQTRQEWNGLMVRTKSYEERHPQDFVRGIVDNQAVPDPSLESASYFGMETTLDADELPGQTTLSVTSTLGMANTDVIKIQMDNGELHLSTVASFVANDTVTIDDALPHKATSGNKVMIIRGS